MTVPIMALYPKIEKRLGNLLFYQLVMSTFPSWSCASRCSTRRRSYPHPPSFAMVSSSCTSCSGVGRDSHGVRGLLPSVIFRKLSHLLACLSIMINDVCPSAEALAAINVTSSFFARPYIPTNYCQGLSQMSIQLPQAIAPALATVLYATSIRSGFLHGHGIWAFLFFAGERIPRFAYTGSSLIVVSAGGAAIHSYTIRLPETDWRDGRETPE